MFRRRRRFGDENERFRPSDGQSILLRSIEILPFFGDDRGGFEDLEVRSVPLDGLVSHHHGFVRGGVPLREGVRRRRQRRGETVRRAIPLDSIGVETIHRGDGASLQIGHGRVRRRRRLRRVLRRRGGRVARRRRVGPMDERGHGRRRRRRRGSLGRGGRGEQMRSVRLEDFSRVGGGGRGAPLFDRRQGILSFQFIVNTFESFQRFQRENLLVVTNLLETFRRQI